MGETMKNIKKSLSVSLVLLSIISVNILSCRPAILKSITVKAEPELRLNLGSNEFKFEEFLSDNAIGKVENMDFFRYKDPTSDVMKFRFHHSLSDLNLDMGNNIENSLDAFKKGLSQTLGNRSFTIPEIKADQLYSVNLGEKIKEALKFPSISKNIPVTGDSIEKTLETPIDFSSIIDTVTFEQEANLAIKIDTDLSNNFSVKITKMELLRENNGELKKWENTSGEANPQMLIGGTELPAKMKLKLTLKISGGNSGENKFISITPSITKDVQEATGVKLDPITQSVDYTFNIESNFQGGTFVEGNIKTGSINLTKENFPSTGVTLTSSLRAEQVNGITLNPITVGDNSLNDQSISNKPLKISGNVEFNVQGATYKKSENEIINCKFDFKIKEFNSIKLKMAEDFKPDFTYKYDIKDLKKWVKQVEFDKL